jgi:hypothetical protein
MSDIFISYGRSTQSQAEQVEQALCALGYGVWRDDKLPAHRTYTEVLDEHLTKAKAVLVLWSADAVKSQWVLSEANRGREDGKLVQLTLEAARLPMPFDTIQCADMIGWSGDLQAPGWRKVIASVAELVGRAPDAATPPSEAAHPLRCRHRHRPRRRRARGGSPRSGHAGSPHRRGCAARPWPSARPWPRPRQAARQARSRDQAPGRRSRPGGQPR